MMGNALMDRVSSLTVLFFSTLPWALAQEPAFDAISVKPYVQGSASASEFGCSPDGRFRALRTSVVTSARWAFDATPYQLVGLPLWANSPDGVYDIEAVAGHSITEAQCRAMVQALLADRFKLTFHREARQIPVSALVVDKNGPKLKAESDTDTGPGVIVNGVAAAGSDKGWSMTQFVHFLARFFPGRTVLDETKLEGNYRFTLNFALRSDTGETFNISDEVSSAVRSLGLKIESRNQPAEVIVVDRFEKPSAN